MATLTVWRYGTPLGAEAGEVRLRTLQDHGALTVHDAVTIAWLPGTHRPRVGYRRHAPVGAAVAHPRGGRGIDQELLGGVISQLRPGTSALLVLSSDADLEEVRTAIERGLARGDVALLHAELDHDAAMGDPAQDDD